MSDGFFEYTVIDVNTDEEFGIFATEERAQEFADNLEAEDPDRDMHVIEDYIDPAESRRRAERMDEALDHYVAARKGIMDKCDSAIALARGPVPVCEHGVPLCEHIPHEPHHAGALLECVREVGSTAVVLCRIPQPEVSS